MNYRQVHLDFHTSEKIPGIGSAFSKEQFQEMLIKGHVDSITVFSKCHHGWAYHPSKANEMHPELDFDLLGAQIEAAHEIGVKTPVYLSAGLDEKGAVSHPEWRHWWKDELDRGYIDFSVPVWHGVCLNSPYLDVLLAQIKEVCENYDADGIFLDIVSVGGCVCYCEHCRRDMVAKGQDYNIPEDMLSHAEAVYTNYTKRVRQTIDSVKPGLPVFHNGGHIRHGRRDLAFANTHLELESLPTGGWGYDHFPMSAAYARSIGMEFLGMTGKFHRTWGEFGGYKHPNALKYEVALSCANGAKCSIGDQLHPTGLMDNATYTLIGQAYKTVEEREPWLKGAKNRSDIAVLSCEAVANYFGTLADRVPGSNAGCTRILLESHLLFDMVDTDADFSKYKLLILPDECVLDDYLAKKVKDYLADGGKLFASYKSCMNPEGTKFMVDLGCKLEGMSEYSPTYIRPAEDTDSLAAAAYLIREDAVKVSAERGEVTATVEAPCFNRTAEHFCGHQHAPSCGQRYSDALVVNGNTAYAAQKLFVQYYNHGEIYVKEILRKTIYDLLGEDISLKTDLPAQGVATLTYQRDKQLVHTLYASPVRRGENVEIIEDIIPIHNTLVSVKTEGKVKSVRLVPENIPLEFAEKDGRVEFIIPKIDCWQITEIQY
jgi:hypothetical protein